MSTATLSSKFQLVIPKEVREKLRLKSGQKMAVIMKSGGIHLIPVPSSGAIEGFLSGMKSDGLRDEADRS